MNIWDKPHKCKKIGCKWLQWVALDIWGGEPKPHEAICILSHHYPSPHIYNGKDTDRVVFMSVCPKVWQRKEFE